MALEGCHNSPVVKSVSVTATPPWQRGSEACGRSRRGAIRAPGGSGVEDFPRALPILRPSSVRLSGVTQGRASLIKEYNIAVQALGRTEDFDPSQDSVVRVEVSRLRKRLQQFYETKVLLTRSSPPCGRGLRAPGLFARLGRKTMGRIRFPDCSGGGRRSGWCRRPIRRSGGFGARGDSPKTAGARLASLAVLLTIVVLVMAFRDRSPAAVSRLGLRRGGSGRSLPGDPVRIDVGSLEPRVRGPFRTDLARRSLFHRRRAYGKAGSHHLSHARSNPLSESP